MGISNTTTAFKKKRKETFSFIPPAFDGIHFDNIKVRMGFHKAFEIHIGTFVTVYLLKIFALFWFGLFLAENKRRN